MMTSVNPVCKTVTVRGIISILEIHAELDLSLSLQRSFLDEDEFKFI